MAADASAFDITTAMAGFLGELTLNSDLLKMREGSPKKQPGFKEIPFAIAESFDHDIKALNHDRPRSRSIVYFFRLTSLEKKSCISLSPSTLNS